VHALGNRVGGRAADIDETDLAEARLELAGGERTGDAADVAAPFRALLDGRAVLGHDVADADAAARTKHARDLAEDGRLVRGEVDHAVADDHIDGGGRQGDDLDVALEELDVGGAHLGGVAPGEGQHLIGHVQAVDEAAGTDPPGRQEYVDAAARTMKLRTAHDFGGKQPTRRPRPPDPANPSDDLACRARTGPESSPWRTGAGRVRFAARPMPPMLLSLMRLAQTLSAFVRPSGAERTSRVRGRGGSHVSPHLSIGTMVTNITASMCPDLAPR
jgi:hypothetical protein